MLFYVPEWDDSVDANYDFTNDEPSVLDPNERDTAFIWDLFPDEILPIDGVLLSREYVESTQKTADRLLNHGVYDDPELNLPDWLPTISDSGAFGYRNLPFPPYAPKEMLEFYEELGVTTGVTLDHMVMGDEPDTTRLYLNEAAFTDAFTPNDLPEALHEHTDVMVDDWPDTWPDTVAELEPSICTSDDPAPFTPADFTGSIDDIVDSLKDDPRAVYRTNDTKRRYELTIDHAREMQTLHTQGSWSFRLMGAVQGWNTGTYQSATEELLEAGFDYIGIGGLATRGSSTIEQVTRALDTVISRYQETHSRRVNVHLFGSAKQDLFSVLADTGTSSFDSASMLRSAWTGGNNYHLPDDRYDAIRTRYPAPTDDLRTAIDKSLASQTLLYALTAYDTRQSVSDLLQYWLVNVHTTLHSLESYLAQHRHDEQFDATRLRDIEEAFRESFANASEVQASFSADFRRRIIKLLRKDDPEDPVAFSEYTDVIDTAKQVFATFSPPLDTIRERDHTHTAGAIETVWPLIDWYTTRFDDTDLQSEYRSVIEDRPWDTCSCPVCTDLGIDVVIFRGNDRNCRRGYHNTYQFYQAFTDSIPNVAVGTITNSTPNEPVNTLLETNHSDFWETLYDAPVAELGVFSPTGFHDWWLTPDSTYTPRPYDTLSSRYSHLFVYTPSDASTEITKSLTDTSCIVWTYDDPQQLYHDLIDFLSQTLSINSSAIPQSATN